MVHGIYMKNRPKSKWQLVSVKLTANGALFELNLALKKSKLEGNDQVQAAIKTFDSSFYIPKFLYDLKEEKLIFN